MQRDTTNHALALKFADMPSGIANRWLAWARSHDWCESVAIIDGKLELWTSDEMLARIIVRFSNPLELRDWAGY